MPIYTFFNEETNVKIDRFYKIGNRPESVIEDGKTFSYIISMPAIVSGVGGIKVPSNLKDRLTQIKKQHPDMKSSVV